MSSLHGLSWKQVERVLKKVGFEFQKGRGKGSHLAYMKISDQDEFIVIIPRVKNIPIGTLRAIIRQSGLSTDQFQELL